MQKRLIHHPLLLLALIFGPAAAASPAAAPQAAALAAIKSSHLINLKFIEQVRLAGIDRKQVRTPLKSNFNPPAYWG
jgi:hypothetical protein